MRQKKLVYLMPNVLTMTYAFLGFLSIRACLQGSFQTAAALMIAAAVLDALDGIIARATHTQSQFGEMLDSLADSFAFGVSTSLTLYLWGFQSIAGTHAVILSFIFLAAAILRLAGYMVAPKVAPDRKHHLGLTVPSASVLVAGIVIYHPQPLTNGTGVFLLAVLVLVLALLMVSNVRYKNLMNLSARRADLLSVMAAVIAICACILYSECLLLFIVIYILSGPAASLFRWLGKRAHLAGHRPLRFR